MKFWMIFSVEWLQINTLQKLFLLMLLLKSLFIFFFEVNIDYTINTFIWKLLVTTKIVSVIVTVFYWCSVTWIRHSSAWLTFLGHEKLISTTIFWMVVFVSVPLEDCCSFIFHVILTRFHFLQICSFLLNHFSNCKCVL